MNCADRQPALAAVGVKEIIDKEIAADPSTDEYMETFTRKYTSTVYHPVRWLCCAATVDHVTIALCLAVAVGNVPHGPAVVP
jgi:hypothetical protein